MTNMVFDDRDIIETHILTKLDAVTLANVGASSHMMHALCAEEKLWKSICTSTWPSINDPFVVQAISTFPLGYRSFFSDSSTHHRPHTVPLLHDRNRASEKSGLISAVDLSYKNKVIFSKVQVSTNDNFSSIPFSVNIPLNDESVTFKPDEEEYLLDLEKTMTLSWILIDADNNRSINMSSYKPILVERRYMPNEVHLTYATVLTKSTNPTQCRMVVTCVGDDGREMQVKGMNLEVVDVDGIRLSREGSSVILKEAMESERTNVVDEWDEFKFLARKRKTKERIQMRYKMLKLVCTIIKIFMIVIFWSAIFC